MKQSAAKTLGVAVLGAAFAATAAGSATAAAAPDLPDAGAGLGGVTKILPTESMTRSLPNGTAEGVSAGTAALDSAARVITGSVPMAFTAATTANPVIEMLGGLPVGGPSAR